MKNAASCNSKYSSLKFYYSIALPTCWELCFLGGFNNSSPRCGLLPCLAFSTKTGDSVDFEWTLCSSWTYWLGLMWSPFPNFDSSASPMTFSGLILASLSLFKSSYKVKSLSLPWGCLFSSCRAECMRSISICPWRIAFVIKYWPHSHFNLSTTSWGFGVLGFWGFGFRV